MSDTLQQVKARVSGPGPHCNLCDTAGAPLTSAEVAQVETRLGRELPPFLKGLLTEVGDGGYGFAYGHLGVARPHPDAKQDTAVGLWEGYRQPDPDDPHWQWPPNLLPLVHLGCAMYLCVDLDSSDEAIVWFEPNPHVDGQPWSDAFFPFGMGLEALMQRWLGGADIVELFEQSWNAQQDGDSE